MTFPIIGRGGGVRACEAGAGGRVSRVGARFIQDRTAQRHEGAARSVTSILHLAALICVQACRPHAVRGPVNGLRRDLRIGARAWAGATRRTTLLLTARSHPASGRGLQCLTTVWPRSFVHENRGQTGDLLPLSYLGAHTSTSPHGALREARCKDNQPRAQRSPTAILGACHVTRAQRHATAF